MEKVQLMMDTKNCIRCGRCVKVCPSQVIRQANKKMEVVIACPESCISCGQCVAICPKGVLTHSAFSAEKICKLNNPLLNPVLRRVMPGVYQYLPSVIRLIKDADEGNEVVLRHATAVLLIHTPKSNMFGATDTNLAYQNASLMAECLGVGHFYIGLVCAAIQQDKKNRIARLLGIDGKIQAGMALGMPEFSFSKYIERKAMG